MISIQRLAKQFLVLAYFLSGANLAYSAVEDAAPIPHDVIDAIVDPYRGDKASRLVLSSQGHISELETILDGMTSIMSGSTGDAFVTQLAWKNKNTLLTAKLHDLDSFFGQAQSILGNNVALADAGAWKRSKEQVDRKQRSIIKVLDSLRLADTRAASLVAMQRARQLLAQLKNNMWANQRDLADMPTPTVNQVKRDLVPPSSEQTFAPAYLAHDGRAQQTLAFAGGIVLTDAPSPPLAPSPEVSSCRAYNEATDLADTKDVHKDDPKVVALAAELGFSPVKIYQYVSDKIKYEPYFGSLKGAVGTLVSGAGNSTDQASLLIALFRASKIPARYVRGNVVLTTAQAQNWLGTKSATASARVLAQGLIPAGTDDSTQVNLDHVWVEACVPYGNYRGTSADMSGHRWIPLDPSIEDKQYSSGISISVAFDYTNYLAALSNVLPQEKFEEQVSQAIKSLPPHYENNTLNDVVSSALDRPLVIDILPASLPYYVANFINWDGTASPETHELPDAHRYKLDLGFRDAATPTFGQNTLFLPEIALQRMTLSFKGASAADQAALDVWKNDTSASIPCSVQVEPSFRLDGQEQTGFFPGISAIGLCTTDNHLQMAIRVTNSSGEKVVNSIEYSNIGAGNYHALQAYAFQASNELLDSRISKLNNSVQTVANPNDNQDDTIGEYLHIVGLKYMRYASDSRRRIGRLAGMSGESGNHLGLTGTSMQVEYLFDLPIALSSKGMYVDVPGLRSRGIHLTTGERSWDNFLLAGYAGSAYEHYIWQENARMDAVSTVRGMQYANANSIPIITINFSNWSTASLLLQENADCGTTLNYCPGFVENLRQQYFLAEDNWQLKIPATRIQFKNWKGTVFLAERNLGTEFTAGYIISGGYAGGFTLGDTLDGLYDSSNGSGLINSTPFQVPGSDPDSALPASSTYNPLYNDNNSVVHSDINQITAGDPVNMLSGNLYHPERDFALKGRGLPIVFERTYNTKRAKLDGPLGFGWTHSFNHFLEFNDGNTDGVWNSQDTDGITSSVTWTDGTGNRKFIDVAGGTAAGVPIGATFTTPTGLKFTVTKAADGTIQVRERNGLIYTFEAVAGVLGNIAKLSSIRDRNGNQLTLGYTAGDLTSIIDDLGRTLNISYYPLSSHIHTIEDWSGRVHTYSYDGNGNLVSYENPRASQGLETPKTYTYYNATDGENLDHAMHTFTHPRGNGMTFEYYPSGRVFRHYNSLGETMTFTYNDFRRESVTVNERGFLKSYFFNEHGRPSKVIDEGGAITEYRYEHPSDPLLMTAKIDPLGYITSYDYDANKNLVSISKPSGNTIEYTFHNGFGQAQKAKDPNGNYKILKYDANGNPTDIITLAKGIGAAIDPTTYTPVPADLVAWVKHGYDLYGNIISTKRIRDFTTLDGPTVTYDYDDLVNSVVGLNRVGIERCGDKDGDGLIADDPCDASSQTYDSLGRLLTGIRDDWYAVSYQYDELNRATKTTDAFGQTRDIFYDENGNANGQQLIVDVDAVSTLADQTSSTHDFADRVITATDAGGYVSRFEYDELGNRIKATNPDGYSIGFAYDANNHWVIAYDEEGNNVSRTLDSVGKPRTVTDANGSTTTYVYYGADKDGRVSQIIDAAGRIVEYDYDANGNVTRLTNKGLGTGDQTTLTTYDSLNRPTRIVGPVVPMYGGGDIRPVNTYHYDNLGRLSEVKAGYTTDLAGLSDASDVLQRQVTNQYDDFGRKLKEIDPLNQEWVVSEYDVHGNPLNSTDAEGHVTVSTFAYGGRLASRAVYEFVGDISPHETSYSYNSLGQVTKIIAPEVSYDYAYNSAHRLSSIADSRGGKSLAYDYSPGGWLNGREDSEGNKVNYLYDAVGRLTGIWAPNDDIISYIYDQGGRIAEKWFPNGANAEYAYNSDNTLQRIVNKTFSGGTVSQHDYSYDQFGNRERHIENIAGSSQTFNYVYDNLNRLTEIRDGASALIENYSYDEFSNRKTKTVGGATDYYEYDLAHQLQNVRVTDAGGAVLTAFSYDNNGNMLSKTEGGSTLTFVYDALNRLSQASKPGMQTETYTYGPRGKRIAKTVGGVPSQYLYNGPDIVAEYGGDWGTADAIYTHGPFMDDPISRISSGAASYYHQDGIGSVVAMTNQAEALIGSRRYDVWGNVTAAAGTVHQYGYTGREPDNTGLMYYRARYYDPATGRFTQRDPLGMIDGVNRYVYAINNPVNFVDPWGLDVPSPGFWDMISTAASNLSAGDLIHFGVDVVATSEVPFVSQGAGLISAGWYAIEGDSIGAVSSLAGMAPGVGAAADATRLGRWGVNAVDTASDAAGTGRQFWTTSTTFQGNRVYQRNDLIDPTLVDARNRTNLERMQSGLAPVGPDGKSINLHHMTQTQNGGIAEVTQTFHQQNSSVIHINPSSTPSGINRADFDAWRRDYWRERANDFQ